MTPADANRMAAMERRILDLERQVRALPSRWPAVPETLPVLRISNGNLLGSLKCIKYSATQITSVPTSTPGSSDSYQDGLGRATHPLLGYVWAAMAPILGTDSVVRTPGRNATLLEGAAFFAYATPVPVSGPEGPVSVWQIWDC